LHISGVFLDALDLAGMDASPGKTTPTNKGIRGVLTRRELLKRARL
jgi:hypothetical protein